MGYSVAQNYHSAWRRRPRRREIRPDNRSFNRAKRLLAEDLHQQPLQLPVFRLAKIRDIRPQDAAHQLNRMPDLGRIDCQHTHLEPVRIEMLHQRLTKTA